MQILDNTDPRSRRARQVVGEPHIPAAAPHAPYAARLPGARLAGRGWTTGTMPGLGEMVVVDAYGKMRFGAAVDGPPSRTHVTVAVTTPAAVALAARTGKPVRVLVRRYHIDRVYRLR